MSAETKHTHGIANVVDSAADEGRLRLIDWAVRYFEGNEPDMQALLSDFDFGELATNIADKAERNAAKT
jgi:hypothetical protein